METSDTIKQKTKAEKLYDKGWHCHNHREYECAAKYYKEAAALGCTVALYYLALLYYEGKGVEKDLAEAAKCFEAVAKSGGRFSEEAKLRLERLADIDSGKGIGIIGTDLDHWIVVGAGFGPGDVEEYRKMWKLAEQGDLKAQYYVAETIWLHLGENGCPDGDGETMMRYLRNLANHGDAKGQSLLAEALCNDAIVGVGIGDVDYEESLRWFRKAAQAGDATALMLLPGFLYYGQHFVQDKDEAFFWQIHYIESGKSVSMDDLETIGFPYINNSPEPNGDGKWWTKEESFRLFKKFAEQGDAIAQCGLAHFYWYGECIEYNRDEAIRWYEKAAKQGNAEAQYELGEIYYDALMKPGKTNRTAVKWYKKAAEQGHKYAQEMLGEAYYSGMGVKQNYEEAFVWYKRAAEQGVVTVMSRLGDMYYSGKGIEENIEEAYKWYSKAEKHNDYWGADNIDYMYQNGDVPSKYYQKELKRYKKEAKNGWHACYRLGMMYYHGMGVEQSDTKALRWYRKMTNTPDKPEDKMRLLADMYYDGEGINQSYEEAIKWYKKAANKGDIMSQIKLTELYYKGDVVEQNFKLAYKWDMRLVKEGAEIYYKIGMYYYDGKGVKQNYKKAVYWFKKAADELSDIDAMKMLGKCYKKGIGVKQNLKEAERWRLKAKKQAKRRKEHRRVWSI